MSEFAYVREGDRLGAPIHRIIVARQDVYLLQRGNKEMLELPEGRDALEFRKEREEAGIEFRYRLVPFTDWLEAQDQATVRKWKGTHEDSIYPEAPEGTFWSEFAPADEPWTVQLLSLETGERAEGNEELVTSVREDLLAKSAPVPAPAKEDAPEEEAAPEEAPVEESATPPVPEGEPEPKNEEPQPAEPSEEVTE